MMKHYASHLFTIFSSLFSMVGSQFSRVDPTDEFLKQNEKIDFKSLY